MILREKQEKARLIAGKIPNVAKRLHPRKQHEVWQRDHSDHNMVRVSREANTRK